MGTVIHYEQRGNIGRKQRWDRLRRAELLDRYNDLQAQGVSQRQAAKVLHVPRTTLQAWRMWQGRLDACPHVVRFFESVPGLRSPCRPLLPLRLMSVAPNSYVLSELGASTGDRSCWGGRRHDQGHTVHRTCV